MAEKKTYVVVFSDNSEHFKEIPVTGRLDEFAIKQICADGVRAKKLTTSRKNPQPVAVELFALEVSDGQLKRRKIGNYEVTPPLERMTTVEYNEEIEEAIDELPPEFQEYVRQSSWDRGHSSGYEEVVNVAKEIASDLLPYIERYQKRIMTGLV
jgi:hypothetical protein